MLNINSPTVQAMMQNVPQGVGNMPVYYGNTPALSSEQQLSTPYPSPKEMLMQSGQQNVYEPTSFAPRNIVGGYNPGYQAAFSGYINPYMGYGYSGYGWNMMPMDEDTRLTLAMAEANDLEYEEQIKMESEMYKRISRTVSKNLNRTEEETKHFEKYFEVHEKHPQQPPANQYYARKPIKHMHVKIKVGDEVVADIPSTEVAGGYASPRIFDEIRARDMQIRSQILQYYQSLHNNASERRMDNDDLVDFLNKDAGVLLMENIDYMVRMQAYTNSGLVYNKEKFKRLLNNNGIKTKSQRNAIDRLVGRYGVMPDGRPVSPGHDPAVASSFSYNPSTGQYSITAPQFLSDRLEKARSIFMSSIDQE